MQIQPYLFFDGRSDEAIAFYGKAIGAEVLMRMQYGDDPSGGAQCPDGSNPPADKVMHATLQVGDTQLMLSDGFCGGQPEFKGISLSLAASDDAHAERLFDALADGGEVTMPLAATFFASSFGMVTDRFGVAWMVSTPAPANT